MIFSQRTKTVIRRSAAGVASAAVAAGTFAAGVEVGLRQAKRTSRIWLR